jgi:hypothetical protein
MEKDHPSSISKKKSEKKIPTVSVKSSKHKQNKIQD